MIYISTSCFKGETIKEVIEVIVGYGFKNIELSGGTRYYNSLESDLIELKEKYHLNYIIHNYFPPPKSDFVLNLSSLNDKIYQMSIQHVKNAIELSTKLNVDIIGIHAGFLIDPRVNDLSNTFTRHRLTHPKLAIDRFCKAHEELKCFAKNKKIYIENNVISNINYQVYEKVNPFLLTCYDDYKALHSKVEFDLLLDIAHLKVSSNTLQYDFNEELKKLINMTNYIHLSDNNSNSDNNNAVASNSGLYKVLKQLNFKNKIITLEISQDVDGVLKTYELMKELQK